MITVIKGKPEPIPNEECPSFGVCSAPICPLDPDMNKYFKLPGEDKCRANKTTRVKIAEKYPELFPFKGLTGREHSGRLAWEARSPQEKKDFIERNTKRLKKLRKGHK